MRNKASPSKPKPQHRLTRKELNRALLVSAILLLSAFSALLPLPGATDASRITMAIFVGAACLWVTELIPPFATAICVIVLEIFLLGKPEGPLHLSATGLETSYQIFLNPLASPVLVLFFGGFILAIAAGKVGLDQRLAQTILKPFARRPFGFLMAVVFITGMLSMFMSNTATTAMMISILGPVIARLDYAGSFRVGLTLAIPFAANIGGMGTLIGTPPNAVAASVLGGIGITITYLDWMIIGFPMAIVLLSLLGFFLWARFPCPLESISMPEYTPDRISRRMIVVTATFLLTVGLWMTEPLHGAPSAVVALIPIMIFPTLGIINAEDLKKIDWDVIVLVAGGLSLGVAMQKSGLSNILVNLISYDKLPFWLILTLISLITAAISNFMSHTAASNIIIPMVTAIATFSPVAGAMAVAFSASLAMSLPISTPPNAIAYATHTVSTRDLATAGTIVSLIGIGFVVTVMILINQFAAFG